MKKLREINKNSGKVEIEEVEDDKMIGSSYSSSNRSM
jgi:hypothetical protein